MIYDITPVNNYTGNNSTTTFEFNFYIENEEQLKVTLYDSQNIQHLLQNEVDYSINELKNKNGSYITFPLSASNYGVLSENEKISLELTLPISQETQYNNSSLLNLEALEYSFDYLTRLIQILSRKQELSIKVSEFSDKTPEDLYNELNSAASTIKDIETDVNKKYNELTTIYENIKKDNDKFNQIDINTSSIATIEDNLADKLDKNIANISSTGKEELTNLVMPDYSAGISITSAVSQATQFIAPTNGIIYFGSHMNSRTFLNGILANNYQTGDSNGGLNKTYFLNKNDTFYVEGGDYETPTAMNNIFYPLRGVQND